MWVDMEGRADSLIFLLLIIIMVSPAFPLLRLFIELKDWLSMNDYLLILIISIDGR